MALSLQNAANLNKFRAQRDILKSDQRKPFDQTESAEKELSQAIDSFFPSLDEGPSDGAAGNPGLLRYHTSRGERINVQFSGDSKKGEYVQEWVDGGVIYTRFDENSVDNYQVHSGGVNHLHLDRRNPEQSYAEISLPGFNLLDGEAPTKPDTGGLEFQEKDGIQYAVLQQGQPHESADRGEGVLVQYTGWLDNGEIFDSSRGRKPFSFPLGAGRVIQGWERGVEGMQVGERRLLKIPSELAYGERDMGKIPPNSPLNFEVELLATSGELTRQ
ncbi:MAG: FKBP-type peptidyl-prolyl cis-trans isomerase [Candidatus Eremiobacteraeota bacterium]|nr:FKBP-type peptidyl-prolyl cis-trans isomerase [Candidatus Eremiobacteraeota bacterium]